MLKGSTIDTVSGNTDILVRAGAGAGKTRRLVQEVFERAMRHYKQSGKWPHIVVTTFTDKATAELRERLMLKALDADKFIEFIQMPHCLHVSTIHGVLNLLLRRQGDVLGLPPSFEVVDQIECDLLARQVFREVIFSNTEWGTLLEIWSFNTLFQKVRSLEEIYNVNNHAQPECLHSMFNLTQNELRRLTENADFLCEKVPEAAPHLISLIDHVQVLLQDKPTQQSEFISTWTHLRTLGQEKVAQINWPRKIPERRLLQEHIEEWKEFFFHPQTDPAQWDVDGQLNKRMHDLVENFRQVHQQQKISLGQIEINDLEVLSLRLLREHPASIDAFAKDWDAWLIDEYQDTSPVQIELLKALSAGSQQFVVGDPQQSIYLFRGARSEVFQEKETQLARYGSETSLEVLKQNYRSRADLLTFFNHIFTHGFDPAFETMEPAHPLGRELHAEWSQASSIAQISLHQNPDMELKQLVEYIKMEKASSQRRWEEICVLARTRKTLFEVARVLRQADLPYQIHVSGGFGRRREIRDILSIMKFLVHTQDDMHIVELLRAPWFRVSDESLITAHFLRRRAQDALKDYSLWQILSADPPFFKLNNLDDIKNINSLKELRAYSQKKGICAAIEKAIFDTGLIDYSQLYDRSGRRESNIWKLLTHLAIAEREPGFQPLQFIYQKLHPDDQESDAVAAVEPARIQLMTVHASKGLQFPVVLLPAVGAAPRLTRAPDTVFDEERGRWSIRWPLSQATNDYVSGGGNLSEKAWLARYHPREWAEHDRVFYVALTRASEKVYLSWSGQAAARSWAIPLTRALDLNSGWHELERDGIRFRYYVHVD